MDKATGEEAYKGNSLATIKPSVVAKEPANNSDNESSHGYSDNGLHDVSALCLLT